MNDSAGHLVHSMNDLRQLQALPLSIKVQMTQARVRDWVSEFGVDGVYVSFSGGKDSTVLLDIVRGLYPEVPAVFVDTGLEYPEIREFVRTFDNVTWIKPEMNFRRVIEKYGYPFISKEVCECVYGAKKYLKSMNKSNTIARQTDRQTDSRICISSTNCSELVSMLQKRRNRRAALLFGIMDNQWKIRANIPKEDKSSFSKTRYKFLLDAPFDVGNQCCLVMKKKPARDYFRKTGRHPITAQMASESALRLQKWLQFGCNAFSSKHPISNPMSFWTEQDVLEYIVEHKLKIASVYGEIVEDYGSEFDGQMDFCDFGLAENVRGLKTTGCQRTGCMFCGYGCHLEKSPNRFERMKETHPKQYEYLFRDWEKGGLGYKRVIDWINKHGNMNIKY